MTIAEILKNAPERRISLYSTVFGHVDFVRLEDHTIVTEFCDYGEGSEEIEFRYDGSYRLNGECVLFPSEFHRTWDEWQTWLFAFGDFITNLEGEKETLAISGFDTNIAYDSRGEKCNICKTAYRWATNDEIGAFMGELERNGLKLLSNQHID